MHPDIPRSLTLDEQIAINDEECVATDAQERANLIDILVHGAHILLEHPDSHELTAKISAGLGREITENDMHTARALGSELALRERGIADSANSSANFIRECGLPG